MPARNFPRPAIRGARAAHSTALMLCGTVASAGVHVSAAVPGIRSVISGSALVMFCVSHNFIVLTVTVAFNHLRFA